MQRSIIKESVSRRMLGMNLIKRDQARRALLKNAVIEMKAALPVYTLDEIRHFRMPYHEALLLHLEDNGYMSTLAFMKDIIQYQGVIRQAVGSDDRKPLLIEDKKQLSHLSDALKKAEDYHKEDKNQLECTEFLKVAIYFAFGSDDWWWLGDHLLSQSIEVSSSYPKLEGKFEALSRYAFAKFQIDNLKEYQSALEQLEIARSLSIGKSWTAKGFFDGCNDMLLMEVSRLAYECLIREAKFVMATDPSMAADLAMMARKRAVVCCYKEGETEALIIKSMCDMITGNLKSAIILLKSALHIQRKMNSKEGMCKVWIQLAKAYLAQGDERSGLRTLQLIQKTAEDNDLPYYLAQAFKNMGEYYLNHGNAEFANTLLREAFVLFKANNYPTELGLTRNLEAISAGMQIFPQYTDLLLSAGAHGSDSVTKLVDWKDTRKPFIMLPIAQSGKESMITHAGSAATMITLTALYGYDIENSVVPSPFATNERLKTIEENKDQELSDLTVPLGKAKKLEEIHTRRMSRP